MFNVQILYHLIQKNVMNIYNEYLKIASFIISYGFLFIALIFWCRYWWILRKKKKGVEKTEKEIADINKDKDKDFINDEEPGNLQNVGIVIQVINGEYYICNHKEIAKSNGF